MSRTRKINVSTNAFGIDIDVDCTYTPGSPTTRDDPGDGGEIEVGRFVNYTTEAGSTETTTWAVFILNCAAGIGETIAQTEQLLEDKLFGCCQEYGMDDENECYDPYEGYYYE